MNFQDSVANLLTEKFTDALGLEFKGQKLSKIQEAFPTAGGSWGIESLLQRKGYVIITGEDIDGWFGRVVTI